MRAVSKSLRLSLLWSDQSDEWDTLGPPGGKDVSFELVGFLTTLTLQYCRLGRKDQNRVFQCSLLQTVHQIFRDAYRVAAE